MNWTLIEIHTDYCVYKFVKHGKAKFYHIPLLTPEELSKRGIKQ